jgi:hypothetical protein
VSSPCSVVLVALSVAVLAGCAGVQVQRVGTDTDRAAYELSGPDLAALVAQAERLCPQGHAVLRQWQRGNRPPGESNAFTNWAYRTGTFSYDLQPEQAQMSIVCKA